MKAINLLLIGLTCLLSVSAVAQKLLPYSFQHQADSSDHNTLRFLTQVTQPNTTFLRLYFAGTQLGEGSYLVLEGADGARQELRKQDLDNWHYSSAYFNGQSVNVSLFTAPGDRNTVRISEVRVTDPQVGQAGNARHGAKTGGTTVQTATSTSANITEMYPYAKAVGRFTNGTSAGGTGWIAPNGAIVTTSDIGYDVIEFNVPPSVGNTIQHPSPQDQYPLNMGSRVKGYHKFVFNGESYITKVGWGVLEALPNGTGLRPGERQQEYFRIATNPSNYILDNLVDKSVDLFHYGVFDGPVLEGLSNFKNLQLTQTSLQKQNTYLKYDLPYASDDRDLFVVYSMNNYSLAYGAPITYEGSNVAIGVHFSSNDGENPAIGPGFRSDGFRNGLASFFSNNSVYVDPEGLFDPGTGEIHKPFRTENKAASDAPAGAQVYFARGDYYGPSTFNRPMTLRAPVGTVRMGVPFSSARKAAGPTISPQLLAEGSSPSFVRESAEDRQVHAYPNPFKEQTEINYPFAVGGPVSVHIFNMAGVPVATFTPNDTASGQKGVQWNGTDRHGMPVPAGLYLVKVNFGNQTYTTKVLKN
ncbi:T9SS type A sorting domain-containing protein [Runella sp. CRIBMP]|uniref:T9SS type A sorting domain-containing protein n=1 Tax=Runella sp. CRIBMP TaxID=2683261 RepID=UPI0014130B0A|nr:T9SS type A sorting domain-containing protein [Runella sp. CRIBMP]NBB23035.1 T9SS type A sorting domain-containing protein [Runella sp. CRIBMP]